MRTTVRRKPWSCAPEHSSSRWGRTIFLHVKATGFSRKWSQLNTAKLVLNVSRLEILWAAATYGRGHWWEAFHAGLVHRATVCIDVVSSLRISPKGWTVSSGYLERIEDERRIGSYRVGMTFAKIVAAKLLRTPWLIHVDELVDIGMANVPNPRGRRGDLAGLDASRDWHVLEAKARRYGLGPKELGSAKAQAQLVTFNQGARVTASACATSILTTPIEIQLADPEDTPPNALKLAVSPDDFVGLYYKPIVSAVNATADKRMVRLEKDLGQSFLFATLPNTRVELGLPEALMDPDNHTVEGVLRVIARIRRPTGTADGGIYIGEDGIGVRSLTTVRLSDNLIDA